MRSPWRAGPERSRPRPEAVLRLAVRTFSELCLTVGTVILLFVAYVLWWTGVTADRAMDAELAGLHERWERTAPAPPAPQAGAPPQAVRHPAGRAFAEMFVPRFGAGWRKPVLEGTDPDTLKRGLGHYRGTAAPGGTGNFAVAGHRRTHGDPFKDFPRLRPGDQVILKDPAGTYTYTVRTGPVRTLPTDVAVLDPVPVKSGFTGPGRYLTLTTCDPEWGHSHRLIVWAELAETRPARQASP
ncbi:class E sortase [Streptomyces bambusae]|uniref:class E sortase n=1 Tax=Streptomyces bambusae TaxID=1550616 RepID=UPI001CFE3D03|nr:class E sortase [Streptomyces bambusae]MCB5163349.1 class E sortase [Streptomyces bambusae]